MPTGTERLAAFLHPIAAIAALGFLFFVASLGLRSRERGGAHLRPRHARLAPWAYAGVLASLAAGLLSTWRLRPDLELAAGVHFRLGVTIAALLGVAALLSRWVPHSAAARRLHPALGLLALLAAAVQVFFGLALLPL